MKQAHRWRRWLRFFAVIAGIFWLAFAASWVWPWHMGISRWGLGAIRGQLFIGSSGLPVKLTVLHGEQGANWPTWTFGNLNGPKMRIGPSAVWRPSIAHGTIVISYESPTVAMTYPLRVSFIPLWWPGVFFLLLALLCWWRLRRLARPGCCPSCRYDLKGLAVPVCPECGSSVDMPLGAPHDAAAHAQH